MYGKPTSALTNSNLQLFQTTVANDQALQTNANILLLFIGSESEEEKKNFKLKKKFILR